MKYSREKILLYLTVVAGIIVIIEFMAGSSIDEQMAKNAVATSVVESINKKLEEGRVAEPLHKQITIALSPWKNDPFLERKFIREDGLFASEQQKIESNSEYIYSGYVKVGNKIFSIINKREYAEGEILEETNLQVIKTETDKVTLRDLDSPDDEPRLIVIPIEQEPLDQKSAPPQREGTN